MNTITISKKKIKEEGGIVILPLEEYRKLSEQAVPAYYLQGKAAKRFDRMIGVGLKEYRAGRSKIIKSLADLD
ncbi:MAG: hypothetical protein HYW90_00895 [Candidatus Sungbacteria bacterium]|nr:hypothetical protein [Candidatus Sungbacteria bacterium]